MAHRIGNTEKIIVGDNSGKIGADNAISISGEFNLCTQVVVDDMIMIIICLCWHDNPVTHKDKAALDPLLQGIPTRNEVNIGNITNMAIGENIGDIGANNNCNVSGEYYISY